MRDIRVVARERDRSAEVSALVEREAGHLLNYFLRRTASAEDAADHLGETLLVLWRRERAIPDDETQARMWMFGIARKVLSGQRRTSARRSALTQRLVEELTSPMTTESDEVAVEIRELITSLHAIDQEIVRLVYWDGFTLAETAQLLGLRPSTVRSRHARARAQLRQALEDRPKFA